MRLVRKDIKDREKYLDRISDFCGKKIKKEIDDFLDSKYIMSIVNAVETRKPLCIANKDKGLIESIESKDLHEVVKAKSNILVEKKYLHLDDEIIHKDVRDI